MEVLNTAVVTESQDFCENQACARKRNWEHSPHSYHMLSSYNSVWTQSKQRLKALRREWQWPQMAVKIPERPDVCRLWQGPGLPMSRTQGAEGLQSMDATQHRRLCRCWRWWGCLYCTACLWLILRLSPRGRERWKWEDWLGRSRKEVTCLCFITGILWHHIFYHFNESAYH